MSNNNPFQMFNTEQLLQLRSILVNPNRKEVFLEELDTYFSKHYKNQAATDSEIHNMLSKIDLSGLYLNKRCEQVLLENGYKTALDVSNINNLASISNIGPSSIKNIKINMLFLEKYLFELTGRTDRANFDYNEYNSYSERYEIILVKRKLIFDYLHKNGIEFIFANSDNQCIGLAHNTLIKHKYTDSKIGNDEYRIIRCLAEYTFLDDLEEIKMLTAESYNCFDKFIVKRR